jgi:phage baseplate assembly protein V
MARSATDPEHTAGEMLQLGTVASVDHAAGTCTVELGNLVTGDLPWVTGRAGGMKIWSPPTEGEQCAVLCPEGDLANGLVLLGIWSDANPPPSNDPDVVHVSFPDGAVLAYNHKSHALAAKLPGDGSFTVDAKTVTINADVKIVGKVDITGKTMVSEDVVGGGISLKNHKHTGVQAGAAQTGTPL